MVSQHYIERPDARKEYENFLDSNSKIFCIYGFSGHGKSTLIRKIQQSVHTSEGKPLAHHDFVSGYDFVALLNSIFEQLCIDFQSDAYRSYSKVRNSILMQQNTPNIEISQEMIDSVNSNQIVNANLRETIDALDSQVRQRLTEIWLDSLSSIVKPNTVLFFDSFERFINQSLSSDLQWFWQTLERLQNRSKNLKVVVCSQIQEIQVSNAVLFELTKFTNDQSENLLTQMGVTDSEYVEAIYHRLAQGHPLVTTLGGKLWISRNGQILSNEIPNIGTIPDAVRWVHSQIIQSLKEPQRSMMKWGALLRVFHLDLLKSVLPEVAVDDEAFSQFQSHSAIERSPDGNLWRFHSLIRQVQITYLRQSEPDEVRTFHEKAFKYHIERKSLEAIYHHIFLDAKEGVDVWYHVAQDYMRTTKGGSDFLFELIQEPELIFENRESSWIRLLKGRYALHHSQYDDAIVALTQLVEQTDIAHVKAHANKHIARAYTYKYEPNLAKEHLKTAQALYESNGEILGFADTFHQMGNVEYYQDNYDEAEIYYLRAIKILKNNNLYANSGNSHLKIGQIAETKRLTQKARRYYKKASKIFKKDADFLGVGNALMLSAGVAPKHQLKKAIQKYYQAIEIFEKIGVQRDLANGYLNLGKCMIEEIAFQSHRKGNFQATLSTLKSAEPYIRKALDIYKTFDDTLLQAWCHLSLSEILTKSINSYEDGFEHLLVAKNLFILAEDSNGVKICQLMIEEIRSEKGDDISLYVLIARWIEDSRNMQQSLDYAKRNSIRLLTEEAEKLLQRIHDRKADWGTKLYLPIVQTARKDGWLIAYNKHWQFK